MTNYTGFRVYQEYIALRNHFTLPSYDYVKYGGKTTVTLKSYMKRKDRFFFEKIARNISAENMLDHLIGNFVYGETGLDINPDKCWVGTIAESEGVSRAMVYMSRQQSLEYCLKKDLTTIKEYAILLESTEQEEQQFPALLSLYYKGKIMPETLLIIDALSKGKTFDSWDNDRLQGDPLWAKTVRFLRKYQKLALPNLRYDIEKYHKIVMSNIIVRV